MHNTADKDNRMRPSKAELSLRKRQEKRYSPECTSGCNNTVEKLAKGFVADVHRGVNGQKPVGTLNDGRQRLDDAKSKLKGTEKAEATYQVESYAYLECLLNHANVPIIAWDPELRVTLFNHAFERLTGMAASEVLDGPLDILLPRNKRKAAMSQIHRAATGERWESIEIEVLCKDGSSRTVLWNSAPIYTADGKTVLSTIAQGQDITERKQVEEALRDNQQRLSAILDCVHTGIALIDVETRTIVDVNRAACEMFGATKEEIVGHVCHKFICPAEKGRCPIADLGQIVDNSERVMIKADGKSVPIIKTVVPITLNSRLHLIDSFIDITERKRAEEALRAANERLMTEQEALKEKNIALREVLNQIDNEKKQIGRQVQSNIDRIVVPILNKLKAKLSPVEQDYVSLLESSLAEIASPFVTKLETRYTSLTTREVEICTMVKNGLTSKEIASALDTSELTVRKQRKNIRKKLGISNDKVNLSSFLHTT